MKPVTAPPIPALAATLGLLLLAGSSQATTIYSETFSDGSVGTPSALNGSTPDITTGAATWTASEWAENGSTATIATTAEFANLMDDSAFLPFTPVDGNVYTLSATMTVPTGGNATGWVALGFAQTNTTTGSFWTNNTAPWLLWRPATATNPNEVVTWLGPGLNSGGGTPSGNASEGPYTGTATFKIVLNTEGAAWTAEWFVNDVSVRTETYGANPTIGYVGFARENGNTSGIDDFSLSDGNLVIAEEMPRLSDFTYDPDTGLCSAVLKGIPGATYKLVEADDLDFASPDQDPIPLTDVTVGSPVGTLPAATAVVTDGNGDATIEFNLGTTKDKSFVRAEQTAP